MTIDVNGISYDNTSLDLSAQATYASLVRLGDGDTKLYVLDIRSSDHAILQYDLPAARDIENASYVGQKVLPDDVGAFDFKPDGTRLYIYRDTGAFESKLEEWDLSPAWDITSATFSRDRTIFPESGAAWGLRMAPDGSACFIGVPASFGGYLLRRYTLSTPWNITNGSGSVVALDPTNVDGAQTYPGSGYPQDFYISADETQLLILAMDAAFEEKVVHQYTLDLSEPEASDDGESYVATGLPADPFIASFDLATGEGGMLIHVRGSSYQEVHGYTVAAATTFVRAAHTASIPLRVAAAHTASIPLRVARAHTAPIPLRLAAAHTASIPLRVAQSHGALIRQHLRQAHTAPIPLLTPVRAAHTAVYDLVGHVPVRAAHTASIPLRVAAAHTASVPLRAFVRQAHTASWLNLTPVRAAHTAGLPLLDHNPVRAAHAAVFSLLGAPRQHLTMNVTLTAGDRTIPVISWDLRADEGGYLYEGSVDVGAAGYAALAVDDAVVLDLFGEAHHLVVESRSRERSGPAGRNFKVGLRSPTIQHDFPRAAPLTKTFETSILARDAVEQLLGTSVTWELVNWPIPAFRLAWEEASPIEAAQQIATAAGGTIETDPDGSLRVRHLYPTSPKDYATAAPARTVDDADDVVSSAESFAPRRLVNRLVIRDSVQGIFSDRLEFKADEGNARAGTLHVYPSPWRTNVFVSHTSNAALNLTQIGETTREETEVVEFAAGTATVAYPIDALLGVEWLYVSLGGLTFEHYARELQAADADGYSLARITYRTRSIDYRLASPTVDQAQLLLEEVA